MNQNRLFVGNPSYQTMENDLQDYFSQAGVVTSVNLMLDKVTGKSRGLAFVEFATAERGQQSSGTISQPGISGPHPDCERRTAQRGQRRAPSALERGPRHRRRKPARTPLTSAFPQRRSLAARGGSDFFFANKSLTLAEDDLNLD